MVSICELRRVKIVPQKAGRRQSEGRKYKEGRNRCEGAAGKAQRDRCKFTEKG